MAPQAACNACWRTDCSSAPRYSAILFSSFSVRHLSFESSSKRPSAQTPVAATSGRPFLASSIANSIALANSDFESATTALHMRD
ncbi:hypothetical protein D9M68_459180 [compost metagenome]